MDLDFVISIISVAKYVVIIAGIIGLIMILAGKTRRDKSMMTQGAYILVLSVVFGICGYLVYQKTLKNVDQKIEEMYYEYQDQHQRQYQQ